MPLPISGLQQQQEQHSHPKVVLVTTGTQASGQWTDPALETELKRLRVENDELRARLDSERRQMRGEREQWLADKQRYLHLQNIAGVASSSSATNWMGSNKRNSINLMLESSIDRSEQQQQAQPTRFNHSSIVTLLAPPYHNIKSLQKQQQQQKQAKQSSQYNKNQQHFI